MKMKMDPTIMEMIALPNEESDEDDDEENEEALLCFSLFCLVFVLFHDDHSE